MKFATIQKVHGDRIDVRVGGSPKLLRGLEVVGGVDDLRVGDTVLLTEADGRVYAESMKARSGRREVVYSAGGGDGSGMTPHAMSYHTDETTWHAGLGESDRHDPKQHTLAGARHTASGLTVGHVVRATGATAFAWAQLQHGDLGGVASADHHDPVTAGDGIDLSVQQVAVDVSDLEGDGLVEQATNNLALGTPSTTTVATSNAVTASSHTHQLDLSGRTLTAGDGLSGGGSLGADRTFTVNVGDGLEIATDIVKVDLSATSGLEFSAGDLQIADTVAGDGLAISSKILAVNVGNGLEISGAAVLVDLHGTWSGLEFDAGDLRVDLDAAFTWTGTHTFQSDIQAECNLDFVGAWSITTTADNLTIAPAGDVIFDPVGDDILPNTGYDLNIGSLSKKYLTLHAAELWVETLVAQNTIATIGGRILVGPTTKLTSDLAPAATTIYVEHNQMASGDRVYMEADGKVEFMSIDSAPGGTGPYSYTVTRNLDGSGANQWYAGDAVFNTGATGDGFIDLYSVSGVKAGAGPTIVGNVRNSATYNDWTEHWAIGNLNGVYGYGADTYGVALGKYGDDHVVIDAANLFHAGTLQYQHRVLDEAFSLLADDIILAHAKDLSRDGEAGQQAAGTGLLDYDYYLSLLHGSGFDGPLLLHSLAESQVDQAVRFLQGCLLEKMRSE